MNIVKKHGFIILAILTVFTVCLFWCTEKTGMFIDEIYTYGLSNSQYAPFIRDVKGGNMTNTTVSKAEFFDYLSVVGNEEKFDYSSVYYNQTKDVHPPLYYWLLHTISSFFPNTFTKWTGLALNLTLYILTLIILYKLCLKLFSSTKISAICALLYGLSTVGLSTMLMIRMYVLLTLLSVSLAYLVVNLMTENKRMLYPLIFLNVFLGMLVHYYFVIYAFFICASFCIWALYRKEYQKLTLFSICSLAGVLCMCLVFPACFSHLFADGFVSGSNAVSNLKDVKMYASRLSSYLFSVLQQLYFAFAVGILSVFPLILNPKITLKFIHNCKKSTSLVVILPALLTTVVSVVISPISSIRYIYNIIPFYVVITGCALFLSASLFRKKILFMPFVKTAGCLCLFLVALFFSVFTEPSYIYPEHSDYDALLEDYITGPCLYFDDNYPAPVTQDMLQLMKFTDVFITDRPDSPALASYVENHINNSNIVVYIDVSDFWSSGYTPESILPDLLQHTGCSSYRQLYNKGLSDVYILTK